MAVVVRTLVLDVDRPTHDRLEQAINANIGRPGGPAPGLMAHIGYPEGEGLLIADVEFYDFATALYRERRGASPA